MLTDDADVVREMKINTRISVVYSLGTFQQAFGDGNGGVNYSRILQCINHKNLKLNFSTLLQQTTDEHSELSYHSSTPGTQ